VKKVQIALTALALIILGGYLVRGQQTGHEPTIQIPTTLEWAYGIGPARGSTWPPRA